MADREADADTSAEPTKGRGMGGRRRPADNEPSSKSGGWSGTAAPSVAVAAPANDGSKGGWSGGGLDTKSVPTPVDGKDGASASTPTQYTAAAAAANGTASIATAVDKEPSVKFGRRAHGHPGSKDSKKTKFDDDVVTDVADIPDVEEEITEDITSKVAVAPNVRANRVQPLSELDSDIVNQLPTAMADGIDLTLLQSALSPQEKVVEQDAPWDFDTLFTGVASEILTETEGESGEVDVKDDDDDSDMKKPSGPTAAASAAPASSSAAGGERKGEKKGS